MSMDARFEDGGEKPLNLGALDGDDLKVIATLTQDSVFTSADASWRAHERRFALLLNRFRWEDMDAAEKRGRPVERVRSILVFDNVMKVASQGVSPGDKDSVLSLLDIEFEPGEDGAGAVLLTLAGDGAFRVEVEALEATLKDVTRPYVAPSHKAPHHDI
ncbi:DUF2948 family protein [Shimia biformata]|uniref:DUF2948 family protein n=1 Tax=Shimia biformata TaxID=1294299 RepID=UPI00195236F9|nr:DUF2948 family protein [Shimia biformata]